MVLSAEDSTLILSFMYNTVSSMLSDLLPVCVCGSGTGDLLPVCVSIPPNRV
uniref:Uncharacterized protein n=1 Tax=Anguilla anguilla TaxID=7936 RepID=A0A0E9Y003_ANGAN